MSRAPLGDGSEENSEEKEPPKDYLSNLPHTVVDIILQYLPKHDLLKLGLTCKVSKIYINQIVFY